MERQEGTQEVGISSTKRISPEAKRDKESREGGEEGRGKYIQWLGLGKREIG